jgi:hypothetical protein
MKNKKKRAKRTSRKQLFHESWKMELAQAIGGDYHGLWRHMVDRSASLVTWPSSLLEQAHQCNPAWISGYTTKIMYRAFCPVERC